jgi:hypothetical protein
MGDDRARVRRVADIARVSATEQFVRGIQGTKRETRYSRGIYVIVRGRKTTS